MNWKQRDMNNKLITSIQNPIIKNIIQLQKKKSARKKQGLFVVEGIRSVNEITSKDWVEYYVTTPEVTEEIVPGLREAKWIIVSEEIYKLISETESPQGALAVVKNVEHSLETFKIKDDGFYLLLENIQDPGNLGTMIRTAHAFGVDGVFISKGSVDVYSPKVVRSTMGSLFHIPLVVGLDSEEIVSYLKNAGIRLYATHLSDKSKDIFNVEFNEKLAIVIGNEGNGISEVIKEESDEHMIIPMPGGSESLNASIATSICLYEVMRSRQK